MNPSNPYHPCSISLETTADGSHTLFLPEMDEHYHSITGAVQEAKHVYLAAGFNQCTKETIHVLEMGFGTGLNTLLTALEAGKRKIQVFYTALEKYPLPEEIIGALNYSGIDQDLFRKIHTVEWEKRVPLTPFFYLHKINADFKDYAYPGGYDIVYYDAFAPDKQADVWSQDLFDALYAAMNPGGILTTYCAKGTIRRMMQQSGFTVDRIPGPPGKREMLRARKNLHPERSFAPLKYYL